jgi:hypothetical protein
VQAATKIAATAMTASNLARVVPISVMRTPPHDSARHVAAPPDVDAPIQGGR